MNKFLIFILAGFCLATSSLAQGKRILFIGDSITDGDWGKADSKPCDQRSQTDFNHIYGHGFMSMCAAHFQSEYPERHYEFFNRGIGGNSLPDLARRWQADVIDHHPDVVNVLIGINDVQVWMRSGQPSFDVEAWKSQYRQLLAATRQANPKVRLVLCTPFTANTGRKAMEGDYARRKAAVDQCRDAVVELARQFDATCLRFDLLIDKLIRENRAGMPEYWVWDGIHPTYATHQRMANMWIKALRKQL